MTLADRARIKQASCTVSRHLVVVLSDSLRASTYVRHESERRELRPALTHSFKERVMQKTMVIVEIRAAEGGAKQLVDEQLKIYGRLGGRRSL